MLTQADESFKPDTGFNHFSTSFVFQAKQSLMHKVKIVSYEVEICWVYVGLLCLVLIGLIVGFIIYCCYCFDDDEKEDMEKEEMQPMMDKGEGAAAGGDAA